MGKVVCVCTHWKFYAHSANINLVVKKFKINISNYLWWSFFLLWSLGGRVKLILSLKNYLGGSTVAKLDWDFGAHANNSF